MTEEEAKTKWCPHGALEQGLTLIYTAIAGQEGGMKAIRELSEVTLKEKMNKCVGSGCMMWEPYKYWINDEGMYCSETANTAKLVEGGDCGLKAQDLSCNN